MKHTICNQVRTEIDEKDLTVSLSPGAMEHLRHCNECQEFQIKGTKLRQIVGSLETVAAPADFDFRLRARLANDRTVASYRSMAPVRVWRLRSAAVAAMLLIFAGTIFVMRQNQVVPPGQDVNVVADNNKVAPPVTSESPTTPSVEAVGPDEPDKPKVTRNNPSHQFTAKTKRPPVAVDFSSTPAPVGNVDENMASVPTFPLDVPQPSFKVSLDDGRGTSRTISVPAVTFGSRRVLSTNVSTNQYAPKGDW